MSFEDGLGLHGGYAGEDGEELGVVGWGHLAEEEEFVHDFFSGEGGFWVRGWKGGWGVLFFWER